MTTEQELRDKLRKIEALFAGAATLGERQAAMAARDRIMAKLKATEAREQPEEMKFTLADGWHVRLFLALCRRYGLKPYRRHGQRRTTVMLMVVPSFVDELLWPEYNQLAEALREYLDEATARIIRDEVFKDAEEPEAQ
jgi:tRNA nucleotidyltransferase (CCA-adding enzyme)